MNRQIEYYQNKLDFEMDASDLFTALEKGENIIPLDTRKPKIFNNEHIPGAINLYHREMDDESTGHLDRSKTYACYCDGIGCNGSIRGAINMAKLGFKVKEVTGGIEWWKFDGYATEGTHSLAGIAIKCDC